MTFAHGELAHPKLAHRNANMGCMNVDVTCECGYQWVSHAASGRTRCSRCRTRRYIPLRVRQQAGSDIRTPASASSRDRPSARLPTSVSSSPRRVGRVVPASDEPASVAVPAAPTQTESGLPSWLTDAIANATRNVLQSNTVAPRGPSRAASAPNKVRPGSAITPVTMPAAQAAAAALSAVGVLLVDGTCGCQLVIGAPTGPTEVRCPLHGRVRSRRARRVSRMPSGARYGGLIE
jgi:hypothetical protein